MPSLPPGRKWKLPPRIKVLEALGAIGDERYTLLNEFEAVVNSSDGSKTYRLRYDLERNAIDSDDNGSKYRGYLGYPSIMVFMLKGKLPFDMELATALKGIEWKKLNDRYKDYVKVEAEAKAVAEQHGVNSERLDEFVDKVMAGIKALKPVRLAPPSWKQQQQQQQPSKREATTVTLESFT